MSGKNSLIKEAAIQIGSGGSAGFVEIGVMYPLDLVKTRLQLQGKNLEKTDAHFYNGIKDCLVKTYKMEGLTSLWKGVLPLILVETPKRAIKFFIYEQFKQFFLFGHTSATPLTYSLAGLSAGIIESILITPFELVKVTLQSNKDRMKVVPSTFAVAKQIMLDGGLGQSGIYKGLMATIWRNGTFNMIYFGFYHSVKDYLPSYENNKAEFLRKLVIGFTTGTIGSCVNVPFDVAKSRIQGPQPNVGQIKYMTTFGTIMTVYKEEGYLALYKGLFPKILRLGPGGAIMLLVYEYMHNYLSDKFK